MTPFLFRGSNLNADFDSYGCLVANAWTMEVRPYTSSHSPSLYYGLHLFLFLLRRLGKCAYFGDEESVELTRLRILESGALDEPWSSYPKEWQAQTGNLGQLKVTAV
ncbi:hypothetical protein ACFE04_011443 [Oxalis oulophora]